MQSRVGRQSTWRRLLLVGLCAPLGMLILAGCQHVDPPKPVVKYENLGPRKVPNFLKGTILERADLENTEPFGVSSYGLVANLRDTGDGRASTTVTQFMIRQMVKHQFASATGMTPSDALNDSRFAVVRVDGNIPPGARKGQTFDVLVSALPENRTTSLAHGDLYETDLFIQGANSNDPAGSVNTQAECKGPIFVNPAYALKSPDAAGAKNSLRYGVVLDGGIISADRALVLRVREPQMSLSRQIESQINQRFQKLADKDRRVEQGNAVAFAQDEGMILLYVPLAYRGDWEHYTGVAMHLYLGNSPEFALLKGKELAAEAVKPNSLLPDISYCWEGLGANAIPAIVPLMSHSDPKVAYAAARAAAFLDEPSAYAVLQRMAQTDKHPFQIAAIQTLGNLPPSQQINHILRSLLDAPQNVARLEAYRVLVKNNDPVTRDHSIVTTVVNEKFVLDIVPSEGPPVIYASRTGLPRLGVMGNRPTLQMPITYTALNNRLMIASDPKNKFLTIFYRRTGEDAAVKLYSSPDLAEIIARLGGAGADNDSDKLDFTYGDIVAIVQGLSDSKKLYAATPAGSLPVSFMLQQVAGVESSVYNAPVISDAHSPNGASGSADGLPDLNPNETVDSRSRPDAANSGRPQ